MELTVQNIYGLLIRSRLLPLEEVKSLFVRWQEEAKDGAANLVRFMAWLVSNKYVTEYQATLLARGHADGFFLNEYKILDRLGKGRMAGVYKAQHQLGQIVAIKVLPPSRAKDSHLLARFHREARLALKLKHPNIVRSFQTGVTGELHFLVMEYLEGETLEDVLTRRGKLPPAEAVRLVYQVLQGLQHMHVQGAVHRDVKPSNLMLVGSGPDSTMRATVKILDIGLGRGLFEEGSADATVDPTLTSEGVLLGTPDYMSPEQARDPRTADIRADIYSTGCVLYHLLAGHPPFPDSNIISQMIRHATETAKPLKECTPGVPDGLQQIVSWMMAKDPAARYPTPERAAQALQVFLAAGSEGPTAEEAPSMKRYLTWLEVESGTAVPARSATAASESPPRHSSTPLPAASGKPPSATLPVPPPRTSPPPPMVPAGHKPSRARDKNATAGKRHSRKQAGRDPAAADAEAGTAVPVAADMDPTDTAFDVELVSVSPLSGPQYRVLGMLLSRRDFVCFGIGAAAGAIATFLGCLLALTGKRHPPSEENREK